MGGSWLLCLVCLPGVVVDRLFLAVLRGCLLFVVVLFPDYTNLLYFYVILGPLSSNF